ncbi:DUF3742 family protein [Burkholderia cepacia]|uniref:DUF3742 family protein n=1 Tax=Burkholderia cepacia TaxID=292 RepID=UPI001C9328C9|nr:DUF3742 family protein [Burkholderia cepacia]MBY4709823.1 DUF3742 family protein [Burkholderia cepacia]MBY4739331.1 DUF3742 family protein [Burkholderia cepacia]MBY4746451.1 DUF3742 family protein [Burkholderia cepacia]MBY4758165.1 DUF3742 family protein [Burkholderia cepacia]MBY4774179.1 DUF3742 family protein [Burkholderia cepacia]
MKKAKAVTFAERAGRTVGRWLKPVVRMESTVWRNVAAAGAPHGLVLTLKWCVRLALLLGLMYLSIVPALIVLILVLLGSRGAGTADEEPWNPSFEVHDYMRTEEEALKPRGARGIPAGGCIPEVSGIPCVRRSARAAPASELGSARLERSRS